MMNKEKIIQTLIDTVKGELDSIALAAQATKAYRESDDLKSEGKYDTRSVEAGYLAVGQMQRLEELKQELKMLQEISFREFSPSEPIGIGALVEIELNSKSRYYFISPTAGGTIVQIEGESILVISVFSPIGNEVLDLKAGDIFEVQTPKEMRSYTVMSVS